MNSLLGASIPQTAVVTDEQQPVWPEPARARQVRDLLGQRPGLVPAAETEQLAADLEQVAQRRALVMQGGDCAELFRDAGPSTVDAKVGLLHMLADILEAGTNLPVVRIGRIGGQYAKPRSHPWEVRADGLTIPVYLGDAVNDSDGEPGRRVPDPDRLLTAHDCAARVLDRLRRHGRSPAGRPVYASHEMLLLDYERPLVRAGYGTSAHFLWVGDRTRQPTGSHIALAGTVANSIGVKTGPSASASDVVDLVVRLNPNRRAGRLTLIVRMGEDQIRRTLPPIVRAVSQSGVPVLWLCDPMHGNTIRTPTGVKTRLLTALKSEVRAFVEILRENGEWPAGLHLETTPDDVTECVDDAHQAVSAQLSRYTSACDPRLNRSQAIQLVDHFTRLL